MISRRRWWVRTGVVVVGLLLQLSSSRRPLICCIPYGPCTCGQG